MFILVWPLQITLQQEHASAEAHAMLAEEQVLARVEAWRIRMEPLLEEQNRISHFDIGMYEGHIIDRFEGSDVGSSIGFTQVVEKEAHSVSDVCRMFVASLQLVCSSLTLMMITFTITYHIG
jgi:hypothetical protein